MYWSGGKVRTRPSTLRPKTASACGQPHVEHADDEPLGEKGWSMAAFDMKNDVNKGTRGREMVQQWEEHVEHAIIDREEQ